MSQILLNLQSTEADSTSAGFTDIVGLTGSAAVSAADSVILLIATIPQALTGSLDEGYDVRFEIDGVLVGPELSYIKDAAVRGCGGSICFAVTLTAASHDFAVQWRTRFNPCNADENRTRSFQVIEITDATILADTGDITSADSATSGFSDVADMTVTPTVTNGATQLILSNMQPDDTGADCVSIFRLAIDDVGVGLEQPIFADSANIVCGSSIMWMVDGLTGSTKFALQWDEVQTSMVADTGRIRRLQVIEITANVNLPFTPVLTNADQEITPGYADVTDLTSGEITPDSADSILLFAAGVAPNAGQDNISYYRLYDGNTGEGPECHSFTDSNNGQETCGHGLFWAATGKSGAHTFTVRGEAVQIDLNEVHLSDYTSSLGMLELLAGGGIIPLTTKVDGQAASDAAIKLDFKLSSAVNALSKVEGQSTKTASLSSTIDALSKIEGQSTRLTSFNATIDALSKIVGQSTRLTSFNATINALSKIVGQTTKLASFNATINALSKVVSSEIIRKKLLRAILKLWSKISGTLLIHRPIQPQVGIVVDVLNSSGPQQIISRSDGFEFTIKRSLSTSQYNIRRV